MASVTGVSPGGFDALLASGRFLITTEEAPPKGADLSALLRRTALLRGVVDAINLTESSSAVMTMSPVGLVPSLLAQGHRPVLQMTCRDRNRIGLQSDLLAAAVLGTTTIVCMAGDPIEGGDQPGARGVFDLDTPGLLRTASALNHGTDLAGNALNGAPRFCLGAVVNPGAADLDREIARMEAKVEAGARFFQTQAVYDPAAFERFMARAGRLGVPVLAGFIVPKSGDMARRMNRSVPGVAIPDEIIGRLDAAADRVASSVELSGRLLAQLAPMCQGLHVIAVGWEQHLPAVLEAAGLEEARA
jgi:5,10-methylenetetrahydrofolate reductase